MFHCYLIQSLTHICHASFFSYQEASKKKKNYDLAEWPHLEVILLSAFLSHVYDSMDAYKFEQQPVNNQEVVEFDDQLISLVEMIWFREKVLHIQLRTLSGVQ